MMSIQRTSEVNNTEIQRNRGKEKEVFVIVISKIIVQNLFNIRNIS